jgi:pimeloyl-ACP methyl ester carboxylesterase
MNRVSKLLLSVAILALALTLAAQEVLAQQPAPAYSGVYKSWQPFPGTAGMDATLYLGVDGTALLLEDTLSGQPPTAQWGTWAPQDTVVTVTLTDSALGPLPQPTASALTAADRTLVAAPGTPLGGAQGRTFYAFDALATGQTAVPYSAEAATAATGQGLAGTYKGLLPSSTCCGRDVTFILGTDGRVTWATNSLSGTPAATEGGAWTQSGTLLAIALTESGGQPSSAPSNLTLSLENGLLRTTAADGAKADLNGAVFYRLEGLANTVPAAPGTPVPAVPPITSTVTAPITTPVSAPEAGTPPAATLAPPAATAPEVAILPTLPYTPVFATTPCPFPVPAGEVEGETLVCGQLTVPEVRSQPDAATVQVFVTILKSRFEPQPAPVVVLMGPAGASATETRSSFLAWPARSYRDIILVDGRGAGYSTPSLACAEVAQGTTPVDAAAIAACFARLNQDGRSLAGYRSTEQAADIADLARTLEAPALDLYGRGEGARLAHLVADRYPQLVRTLVLDGPAPLLASPLETPLIRFELLKKVLRECAADAECALAYPDLARRLDALVAQLDATPGAEYGTGAQLLELLLRTLETEGGKRIPALITALYRADTAQACALVPGTGCPPPPTPGAEDTAAAPPTAPKLAATRSFTVTGPVVPASLLTLGAAYSQYCAEEAPQYTAGDLARIGARLPVSLSVSLTQPLSDLLTICQAWTVPPAAAADRVALAPAVPTLVMGGTHDPASPPAWARRAAAGDDAVLRLFPGRGRITEPADWACLGELVEAFLNRPDRAPNPSCYRRLHQAFSLPE